MEQREEFWCGPQFAHRGAGAKLQEEIHSDGGGRIPYISLPKCGVAIRSIGENLGANPVTSTATLTVLIATSPGSSGFRSHLSLSYDSRHSKGSCGFDRSLLLTSLSHSVYESLHQYHCAEVSDVFIPFGTEHLVTIDGLNVGSNRVCDSELPQTRKRNQVYIGVKPHGGVDSYSKSNYTNEGTGANVRGSQLIESQLYGGSNRVYTQQVKSSITRRSQSKTSSITKGIVACLWMRWPSCVTGPSRKSAPKLSMSLA